MEISTVIPGNETHPFTARMASTTMNDQAGNPTKPRSTPIAIWVVTAVIVLVAGVVLWLGWPKKHTVLPSGASEVQVYLIADEPVLTTPAATGLEDRWFGRISFPCGTNARYVESAGTAMCAWLDGPYGKVTVTSGSGGIELGAAARRSITGWVAEAGGDPLPTRALLVHDGEPVGIVTVADPGTAVAAG
ncbi:hypothetical protein [Actinoplanes sp. G11-F43]|uniref:hypothetical protein n=1 Tax=Actinoplanes sp. G11-F43 TaxID=3424130 RepID=UPI003D33A522